MGKAKTFKSDFAYKTALCDYWMKTGTCKYGSKCHYAHGHDEMRSSPESNGRNGEPILFKSDFPYKTVLFDKWAKTGTCKYGSKCHYAHGRDELRPRISPELSDTIVRAA